MVCNGIVGPDLTPHPGVYEVAKIQSSVGILLKNEDDLFAGTIQIWKKYLTLSLSHLDIFWELTEDGYIIQSGHLLPMDLAPDQKGDRSLPIHKPERLKPGSEYVLNVRFCLAEEQPWAKQGHPVGGEQFKMAYAVSGTAPTTVESPTSLKFVENADLLQINGEKFSVAFSKSKGKIVKYTYQNELLI